MESQKPRTLTVIHEEYQQTKILPRFIYYFFVLMSVALALTSLAAIYAFFITVGDMETGLEKIVMFMLTMAINIGIYFFLKEAMWKGVLKDYKNDYWSLTFQQIRERKVTNRQKQKALRSEYESRYLLVNKRYEELKQWLAEQKTFQTDDVSQEVIEYVCDKLKYDRIRKEYNW